MQEREERQNLKMGISLDSQVCVNCTYFYRHYVFNKSWGIYTPTYGGHCCYPRLKNRKIYDSCMDFQKGTPEDRYASYRERR